MVVSVCTIVILLCSLLPRFHDRSHTIFKVSPLSYYMKSIWILPVSVPRKVTYNRSGHRRLQISMRQRLLKAFDSRCWYVFMKFWWWELCGRYLSFIVKEFFMTSWWQWRQQHLPELWPCCLLSLLPKGVDSRLGIETKPASKTNLRVILLGSQFRGEILLYLLS